MKDLIEFIVKALVDDPSEVSINEIAGDKITLFELRVAKEDIGKVIGKRGTMRACSGAGLFCAMRHG